MKDIVTYITEALKLGNNKRNHNLEKEITDILVKELLRIKNITQDSFDKHSYGKKQIYTLYGKKYLQNDCIIDYLNLDMFSDELNIDINTNINQFGETQYIVENEKLKISLFIYVGANGYIREIGVSENIYQRIINYNR